MIGPVVRAVPARAAVGLLLALAFVASGCLAGPTERGPLGQASGDPCDASRGGVAGGDVLVADVLALPVEELAEQFATAVDEPWVRLDHEKPLRTEGADTRLRWRFETPTGHIDIRTFEGDFESLTWTTQRVWPGLEDDAAVETLKASLEELGLGDRYLFSLQMETDTIDREVVADPVTDNDSTSSLDGAVLTTGQTIPVQLHRGEAVQVHDEEALLGTGFWFVTTPLPSAFDPNVIVLLPAYDLRFAGARIDRSSATDLAAEWLECRDETPTPRGSYCERALHTTEPRLVVYERSLAYAYDVVRVDGPRFGCSGFTVYLDATTGAILGRG